MPTKPIGSLTRDLESRIATLTPREQLMNWVCADPEHWQLEVPTQERLHSLQTWIHEHRLGGWLYWRFQQGDRLHHLPPTLRDNLQASFHKATCKALLYRSELERTVGLLTQANIPSVALKGSYLQRYIFPKPGLRPMRDLDILVPQASFKQAWQVLSEQGYQLSKTVPINLDYLLPAQNQIALISPHNVKVELHRAIGYQWPVEPSTLSGFWDTHTSLCLEQDGIRYLCLELLYIHLCVHHSGQHHWNIGPLGWVDLHWMAQSAQVIPLKMQQLSAQLHVQSQVDTALAIYQQIKQTAATGAGSLSLLFLPPTYPQDQSFKLNRLETYSLKQAIALKWAILDPIINPGVGLMGRWVQLLQQLRQWITSPQRRWHFWLKLRYRWHKQKLTHDPDMELFLSQLRKWYGEMSSTAEGGAHK